MVHPANTAADELYTWRRIDGSTDQLKQKLQCGVGHMDFFLYHPQQEIDQTETHDPTQNRGNKLEYNNNDNNNNI